MQLDENIVLFFERIPGKHRKFVAEEKADIRKTTEMHNHCCAISGMCMVAEHQSGEIIMLLNLMFYTGTD